MLHAVRDHTRQVRGGVARQWCRRIPAARALRRGDHHSLRNLFPDATPVEPGPLARRVIDGVTALLNGGSDPLTDIDLDLTGLPDFDRRVYAVTCTIGPGRTRTYGEVAVALGSPGGAQAVGQALGRNPIPILVPCHRVLAAHGAVGGFSASGGTVTKRALLAAERVPGFDDPTLF